jgi:CAAX prenyl protease-like protein
MLPYVVPFAIFIGLGIIGSQFENGVYIIYPIKTVAVAISLFVYRKTYTELFQKIPIKSVLIALLFGIVVFVIWILPEGLYPTLGESQFNPFIFENRSWIIFQIIFRLIGAVLVVPIFEELFWRSFLIRWIIDQDFKNVSIGKFTWLSFGIVVLFFGLEHHRWLVGMAAGVLFNGLLYKEKNLWSCIIAHAVTNLALGVYVLITHNWSFW